MVIGPVGLAVDDDPLDDEQAPRVNAPTTAIALTAVTRLNLSFIALPHFFVFAIAGLWCV
jgi:hypothetical protein